MDLRMACPVWIPLNYTANWLSQWIVGRPAQPYPARDVEPDGKAIGSMPFTILTRLINEQKLNSVSKVCKGLPR
jgi:hypothetical protein